MKIENGRIIIIYCEVNLNSAARLITRTKKHAHITPVLKQLHWLPIQSRINFKLLLLTYQCLNSLAPEYLSEELIEYVPSRNLRSSQGYLLKFPVVRTKFYVERSFCYAAPKLWNTIPSSIREVSTCSIFKSRLKTYLFKRFLIETVLQST